MLHPYRFPFSLLLLSQLYPICLAILIYQSAGCNGTSISAKDEPSLNLCLITAYTCRLPCMLTYIVPCTVSDYRLYWLITVY